LAAARAGKRLLLANKESLVLAGDLLMRAAHDSGAVIVPIDSEHNAIFQCLPRERDGNEDPVRRIVLTASGGPFRGWTRDRLASVTPEQAVAHPKWSMGPKISVDSATLMNKGLEVIEAHHLFGLPRARIDVLVHPQSLVHSLVEFVDGSTLAQLGLPDMRTALAVGFAWPNRPIWPPFPAWRWPLRRWNRAAARRRCSTR
jgi:1-deoxy-D-xylulose-5-phosphate reductoisomerase